MPTGASSGVEQLTPHALATVVYQAFQAYDDEFRAITRRAAQHFEARDWNAVRHEASERLELYVKYADRAIREVDALAGGSDNPEQWARFRDAFAALAAQRSDQEIAETFFNSVTRRKFATLGVDLSMEFLRPWQPDALKESDNPDLHTYPSANTAEFVANILSNVPHTLRDADGDAQRIMQALNSGLTEAFGDTRFDQAHVLAPLFYRNKGAYVVGRIKRDNRVLPLVIAFLSGSRGVRADAVLTSSDEASVVFGFSRAYFHVDVAHPGATVAFLQSIMPHKRVDELYTAIGYHKHGKTELFRLLTHHLAQPDARFEEAEGARGLVMAVFTLPSLNIVLKIIKDRIGAPKRTTRSAVMEQYHRVFLRDRVGRLADAQLFQGLEFRRECFPDALLSELLFDAPTVVREHGNDVVFDHIYTERRVRPLNLYLREVSDPEADAAILDYGQAIRDLAAANIFPGDLLLKNFGVSRHGRVIFYDYDELAVLTDCNFRELPEATSAEDEMSAEPWFSVAEHDVFPQEFLPFLLPAGRLRDVFLSAHADILRPEWWTQVQERLKAGEMVDTFPYPAYRRITR